jgi:uncharacterized protein (DUF302 family)
MKYVVKSSKSAEDCVEALKATAVANKFGVLHVHDLQNTLISKGFPFGSAAFALDVCNPKKALEVLSFDISMAMVLPCKISVWEKDDAAFIGMVRPTAQLALLNDSEELDAAAAEVEATLIKIIDEAAA